jgi:hypothetical protein
LHIQVVHLAIIAKWAENTCAMPVMFVPLTLLRQHQPMVKEVTSARRVIGALQALYTRQK